MNIRYTITEDTINKAINESIDEFMLEEGFGDTLKDWGQKVKGWGQDFDNKYGNRFSKAWNGLKNGVKAYMDYRTNGQWNREYNSYVKGNGKFSGNFYISKWLDYHYRKIQDIVYGDYYGNKTYYYTKVDGRNMSFEHDWRNNSYTLVCRNGYYTFTYNLKLNSYTNEPEEITVYDSNNIEIGKSQKPPTISKKDKRYDFELNSKYIRNLSIYKGEDNSTPESYIANNCTSKAFLNYTRNKLEGNYIQNIIAYINSIQKINNQNIMALKQDANAKIDYDYILGLFTMKEFQKWLEKNGNNNKNNTQQTAQQTGPTNTQQTAQQTGQNGTQQVTQQVQNGAQQNNQPIPNNKSGQFNIPSVSINYNGNQYPKYRSWVRGKDAFGRDIIINPHNPKEAMFVND